MITTNKNNNSFEAFIRCSCERCGLLIDGIDFDFEDYGVGGFVKIWMAREAGFNNDPWANIWQRLKIAWDVFRGRRWYINDMVLGREGVQELHAACQTALDMWPETKEANLLRTT